MQSFNQSENLTRGDGEKRQESSYIHFPEYARGDKKRFLVNPSCNGMSLAKLASQIDVLFDAYLQKVCEPGQYKFWQSLLDQRSLSAVVREVFTSPSDADSIKSQKVFFDFSDTKLLTPEKLAETLLDLQDLGDYICGRVREGGKALRGLSLSKDQESLRVDGCGTSPLTMAFRLIFNDAQGGINGSDQYLIPNFFAKYLRSECFFQRSESSEEIVESKRIRLMMDYNSTLRNLIGLVAGSTFDENLQIKAIHILFLAWGKASDEEKENFLEELERFDASKSNIEEQFEALLQKTFPRFASLNFQEPAIRLANIKQINEVMVLPANNFVFQKDASESSCEEWNKFPDDGNYVGEKHAVDRQTLVAGTFDINVFDSEGQKVFWGDLPLEAIKDIKGPFYVLRSRDAYSDVPAGVVEYRSPSKDIHREKVLKIKDLDPKDEPGRIAIDYVKAKAIGKIENGKFIPNSLEIDLSEFDKYFL